jgi:hypothetical protein
MDRVRDRYVRAVELWRELRPTYPSLSAPFVVSPAPAYGAAQVKLMVVGQETFGWGEGSDHGGSSSGIVDVLANEYASFDLGAEYRSTPFWSAADHVFRALNPEASSRAFLWSNLNKMDCGRSRIAPEVEERIGELALLQEEIRAYEPDVVAFFTGPRYDARLLATFSGARLTPVTPQLARVIHPDLPRRTYRTYHPRYLRMSKNWHALDVLIQECSVA